MEQKSLRSQISRFTTSCLVYNILFCFRTSFSCFRRSSSALSRFVPWDKTGQLSKPWHNFELVQLSLCPGTMNEFLSLCPKKLHCPALLETLEKYAFKMVLALLCHCSLGLAASCMFNSSVLCAPQLVFLTPKKGNVESKRELFPIFVFSFLHVIIGAVRSTSILCWVAADKRKIVEECVYQMASGLSGFLRFWLLHENIATVKVSCF